MLYAIKSDTLFLSRHTNNEDLEAFTFLYPRASATLVRKMEGAAITLERLMFVTQAVKQGQTSSQLFTAHLGKTPREDLMPYVADFLLQLEGIKWSIVSGVVNDIVVVSVRNLGYSRSASDFLKHYFDDIGNAGGHRAMAKAVIPIVAFRKKFGTLDNKNISKLLQDLALQFLKDTSLNDHRRNSILPSHAT